MLVNVFAGESRVRDERQRRRSLECLRDVSLSTGEKRTKIQKKKQRWRFLFVRTERRQFKSNGFSLSRSQSKWDKHEFMMEFAFFCPLIWSPNIGDFSFFDLIVVFEFLVGVHKGVQARLITSRFSIHQFHCEVWCDFKMCIFWDDTTIRTNMCRKC